MNAITALTYFYPDYNIEDAIELLQDKKFGSFLIRLSWSPVQIWTRSIDTYTISYVSSLMGNKMVYHRRLLFDSDQHCFYLEGEEHIIYSSIEELREACNEKFEFFPADLFYSQDPIMLFPISKMSSLQELCVNNILMNNISAHSLPSSLKYFYQL